jgi:hypothetical protein
MKRVKKIILALVTVIIIGIIIHNISRPKLYETMLYMIPTPPPLIPTPPVIIPDTLLKPIKTIKVPSVIV